MRSQSIVVGAFVVGGSVLLALAFAVFGGADAFSERDHFTAYFEEDTHGLTNGASVLLNGVRIGFVSDVDLILESTTFSSVSLVTMELLPDSFLVAEEGVVIGRGSVLGTVDYDKLIYQAGARAQLAIQSLITGQMVVNLSLRPDTKPLLRGVDPRYPEIPTVASDVSVALDATYKWITDLTRFTDAKELSLHITRAVSGIDELVNSDDVRESLSGMRHLFNSNDVKELNHKLTETLVSIEAAAFEVSSASKLVNSELPYLINESKETVKSLNEMLATTSAAMNEAQLTLEGSNYSGQRLDRTLREIERAAISSRTLFDTLEKYPESLLRGKPR